MGEGMELSQQFLSEIYLIDAKLEIDARFTIGVEYQVGIIFWFHQMGSTLWIERGQREPVETEFSIRKCTQGRQFEQLHERRDASRFSQRTRQRDLKVYERIQ